MYLILIQQLNYEKKIEHSLPGGNACTELLGIGAGVLYLSGSQDGGADRTGAGKERE